jgi:excisionase family DNA binding protein
MDDYLTARQTQELLKVDRITVYRMINDGRLHGTKIGQQWRFSRGDVESLLNGLRFGEDFGNAAEENSLPVHCLQTIQDLFSAVSEFPAVLINMQGMPITTMSRDCGYCRLVCGTPAGKKACQASWGKFIQLAHNGERRFTCHAGLHYAGTFVSIGADPIGLFLVGGFRREGVYSILGDLSFEKISQSTGAPQEVIRSEYEAIPLLLFEQEEKIDAWAASTSQAFESILQERSTFARRLKKIADLTQIP